MDKNPNNQIFLQNKYEEKIEKLDEQVSDQAFEAKLDKRRAHRQKSYSKRALPMYRISNVVGYLGNIYSLGTGALCAAYVISLGMGESVQWKLYVAGGIGIGLAIALEVAKRWANDTFFDNWFYARTTKNGLLAGVLILAIISISSSFYASTILPQAVTEKPVLEDLAVIASQYDTDIDKIEADAETYRKSRLWQDRLATKDANEVKAIKSRIPAKEKEKNEAIEAARTRNDALEAAHNTKTENEGMMLGWFSIGFEVLFILSFWYNNNYLYKCDLERHKPQTPKGKEEETIIVNSSYQNLAGNDPNGSQAHAATNPTNATTINVTATTEKKRPIGFYNDNHSGINDNNSTQTIEAPTPTTIIVQKETIIVPKDGFRNCIVCGSLFHYNANKHIHCSDKCRLDKHKAKNSQETTLFDILNEGGVK